MRATVRDRGGVVRAGGADASPLGEDYWRERTREAGGAVTVVAADVLERFSRSDEPSRMLRELSGRWLAAAGVRVEPPLTDAALYDEVRLTLDEAPRRPPRLTAAGTARASPAARAAPTVRPAPAKPLVPPDPVPGEEIRVRRVVAPRPAPVPAPAPLPIPARQRTLPQSPLGVRLRRVGLRTLVRSAPVWVLLVGAVVAYATLVRTPANDEVTSSSAATADDERRPGTALPGLPAAAAPLPSLSIAWVGDITPGSRYGVPPGNGDAQFDAVRDRLRDADLTIGNLEGTFATGGASKCGADTGTCFSFQAPPKNAVALKNAGFDVMNVANNHAYDFGPGGQQQTVRALRANGLAHTGRPGQVTVVRRAGVPIALVGFAPYPWSANVTDLNGVRRLVKEATRKGKLVIALAHLGAEGADKTHVPAGAEAFLGEDRGDSRAFARAAIDAGADLVLASGPHVLRGMERYKGRLIAYSLANFAGWKNFPASGALGLSGILKVRVSPSGRVENGRFTSMRLVGPGTPERDPTNAAAQLVEQVSKEDFGGTSLDLDGSGSFRSE